MLNLPETYFISVALATVLLLYGTLNLSTSWGIPYLVVVVTVAAWYFIDPIYFPEWWLMFNEETISAAYGAVLIALISFAFSTRTLVDLMTPKSSNRIRSKTYVSAERAFVVVFCLWLALLSYGIVRMDGDVFGALFPLQGRSGPNMWSRAAAADAGDDGFLVSAAGYLYDLCLASFGILYSLTSKRAYRVLTITVILISWPYAALQGSRNVLLAVVVPALASYCLFSKQGLVRKSLVAGVSLVAIEAVLRIIIEFRNVGFENVDWSQREGVKHLGLNMASELVYCIQYINDGTLELDFGRRYLADLANIIPRAVWADKPLLAIDYAVARGFGSLDGDIGVYATISTGLIGGGVLGFGPIFGPILVGLLMASWVGLLARFRSQGTPLRLSLFLIGLGLTFNLGRDITMLVLWPLVFGYIGVRLLEGHMTAGRQYRQTLRTVT